MINIIPFKVKLLPYKWGVITGDKLGAVSAGPANYDEGIYTVVGVTNECAYIDNVATALFLVAREGKITFWYPQIYCEIVKL